MLRNKRFQYLAEQKEILMTSSKNKFDSVIKTKEENRKLKDKLGMLEQGKLPKSKKETETEDMVFSLNSKIESLQKIRK